LLELGIKLSGLLKDGGLKGIALNGGGGLNNNRSSLNRGNNGSLGLLGLGSLHCNGGCSIINNGSGFNGSIRR
jgi:hypothetical protein